MTLTEYKKEITEIFRENTRRGFADWRQCGYLCRDLTGFLEKSAVELTGVGRYKDLFEVTLRAFVKWSGTDKDDSNGETYDFFATEDGIWDRLYEKEPPELDHASMFDGFMCIMDGSLVDYMEDHLLDYVTDRFVEPELLERKLAWLEAKIGAILEKEKEKGKDLFWSDVPLYRNRVIRVYADQKRPIEAIREYAKDLDDRSSREILGGIELEYGNREEALAIYRELAAKEARMVWGRHPYNVKLKELYKEHGLREEYEAQLERLLRLDTGDPGLLEEYRSEVPPEDWESERDRLFDSFPAEDERVLQWYASEGCYDRLMNGVEACGYAFLKCYAKLLEGRYPSRCLSILTNTACEDMASANTRAGYQHVARVLRWMRKFPGGKEEAARLAGEFRAAYPRRPAMIEELEGF